jgi:hypothetical protein
MGPVIAYRAGADRRPVELVTSDGLFPPLMVAAGMERLK